MKLQELISTTINYPVQILDSYSQNSKIAGQFFASGKVYDYKIARDSLEYLENDQLNAYLEGYTQAKIQQIGLRTDSDNPYEYLQGALFLSVRMDDKCVAGVSCGGACLPRGSKCRLRDRLQHSWLNLNESVVNTQEKSLKRRHQELQDLVDQGVEYNTVVGAGRGASQGLQSGSLSNTAIGALAGAAGGASGHYLSKQEIKNIKHTLKEVPVAREKIASERAKLTKKIIKNSQKTK